MTDPERHELAAQALPEDRRRVALCPDCGCGLVRESGCVTCVHCGWARCP